MWGERAPAAWSGAVLHGDSVSHAEVGLTRVTRETGRAHSPRKTSRTRPPDIFGGHESGDVWMFPWAKPR